MNNTKEPSHGNKISNIQDFEYGMGVSFGTLLVFIIITCGLWKCINFHMRSGHGSNFLAAAAATPPSTTSTTSCIAQGLDEATLLRIPKLLYSETKSYKGKSDIASDGCCSICLADFKDSHMLRQLPYCGHFFHVECIDPWLRLHPSCPICRDSPLMAGENHC